MSEQYRQSLSHLLPPGAAYPRDLQSVVQRLLSGVARAFEEQDMVFLEAAKQWIPVNTCSRLEDWEAALGLPDACISNASQDNEYRRVAALDKLGFPWNGLRYEDSSPASPGFIERQCADAGFNISVSVWNTFRVGNRVGSRLGNRGLLVVTLLSAGLCAPFRVGKRVGMRLRICNTAVLECVLNRLVPARFAFVIVES